MTSDIENIADQHDRLASLDALRGVCAILTAFRHSFFLSGYDPFPAAYLVVDIFFLMSGFVLCLAYDKRLQGPNSLWPFMARRYARLAPMWILSLAIGFVIPAAFAFTRGGFDTVVAATAFAMIFIPIPTTRYLFPLNSPGWSLFFEMLASLIYGLTARRLSKPVLCSMVAAAAIGMVALASRHGEFDSGALWATADLAFFRVAFSFFLGILIYKLPRPRLWKSMGMLKFCGSLLGLTLLTRAPVPDGWRLVFDLCVVLIVSPAVLVIALKTRIEHDAWAEALGTLSYPLYAIHLPAMMALYQIRGVLTNWPQPSLSILPTFMFTTVLIGISYVLGQYVAPGAQAATAHLLRISGRRAAVREQRQPRGE